MATMTVQNAQCPTGFVPSDDADPAVPGDPWRRLRYHYGQLLGAEDFSAEQRATILRHRLVLALLHGTGTAWGLKVDAAHEDAPPRTVLTVDPGLAIDVLGREIYVDQRQCLDITGLHNSAKWIEFAPSPVAESSRPSGHDKHKKEDLEGEEDTDHEEAPPDFDKHRPKRAKEQNASGTGSPLRWMLCPAAGIVRPADGRPPESGTADPLAELACAGRLRRGYIVLSYQACLSEPVPAITPPCGDPEDAFAYSRVADRFRIDLLPEPPKAHSILRGWLDTKQDVAWQAKWPTLRDRLLEHLMNVDAAPPPDLACLWQRFEQAPMLLAVVDLIVVDTVTRVFQIDNTIRALLPSVQLVAEQLFGQRLAGPDCREPLKVLTIDVVKHEHDAAMQLRIVFSQPVAASTLTKGSVRVHVLEETKCGLSWNGVDHGDACVEETVAIVPLKCVSWYKKTTFQVHLTGEGARPIVTADGRPLAGWCDEPVPAAGRGRDVSVVRTWAAIEAQGEQR